VAQAPGVIGARALTASGCSTTLTPGTLTIDVGEDEIFVHALDAVSAQDVREGVIARRLAASLSVDTASMTTLFLVFTLVVLLLMIPFIARVIVGPTVFDRVVAVNAGGHLVPLLLVLIGLDLRTGPRCSSIWRSRSCC
jgi:hypothetical protein